MILETDGAVYDIEDIRMALHCLKGNQFIQTNSTLAQLTEGLDWEIKDEKKFEKYCNDMNRQMKEDYAYSLFLLEDLRLALDGFAVTLVLSYKEIVAANYISDLLDEIFKSKEEITTCFLKA
jgi:hypothetical protein